MANYQSTHTGAEIDAGIDLLDKNSATQGQVLTANGAGGASWQNASGGSGGGTQIYRHYLTWDGGDRTGVYYSLNSTPCNSWNDVFNDTKRITDIYRNYSTENYFALAISGSTVKGVYINTSGAIASYTLVSLDSDEVSLA